MSGATPPADRRHWLQRLRFPLVMLALPVLFFIANDLITRLDVLPRAAFPLMIAFQLTLLLAVVTIPAWFLFFSGFAPRTKLLGVVAAVLVVGTLVAVTRKVEYTGTMRPIFVFRWEPDPEVELAKRLSEYTPADPGLSVSDVLAGPDDFPRYRGPFGDGTAPAVKLGDWSKQPPREIWRQAVGGGYAGFAVAGKIAVTLEQRGDDEAVVCYDRATGKELWSHRYPAHFQHTEKMGGGGPRATPTLADGDVYSLGALGDLVCLDATTGQPRWAVNILKDNGAKNLDWAMAGSPLVTNALVLVNPGIDPADNKHQAIAAYDRKTGRKVWATGSHPAGYSSPRLAALGGREQVLLFDAGGLVGLDPADGKELWRYPWDSFAGMNIVQPLVLPGDRVFVSSQATNGCALLHVKKSDDGWSVTPVWKNRNLGANFANPVYHEGHIYGLHNGYLSCLDAKTGKRLWKEERVGSGQVLLTGDNLLVQTEDGELLAVAADPSAYRELGRVTVFDGRTWNTPALAGGRLYLRNHREMVCLELP